MSVEVQHRNLTATLAGAHCGNLQALLEEVLNIDFGSEFVGFSASVCVSGCIFLLELSGSFVVFSFVASMVDWCSESCAAGHFVSACKGFCFYSVMELAFLFAPYWCLDAH